MHDDVKWILGLLLVFGVFWLAGKGPAHPERSSGPFLMPLPPAGTGEVYGPDFFLRGLGMGQGDAPVGGGTGIAAPPQAEPAHQETVPTPETAPNDSPLKGQLRLSYVSAGGDDPGTEYISITAEYNNAKRVLITGLTLESVVTGRRVSIPSGVYLVAQGSLNTEEPVYLEPNGVAYIITGRSPIGYSFRLNRCIGFFEQFQDFNPSLPLECPEPTSDNLPETIDRSDDQCRDYIESLAACEIFPNPPEDLSPTCREYIRDRINYPQCVRDSRGDEGFWKNDWRIYLKRDSRLWKDRREIIRLLDQNGKVVDTISY